MKNIPTPRPRGFTLIELVIGLTVAALVMSAVMQLVGLAIQSFTAARVRLGMSQEANAVAFLLDRELAAAGVGRATGARAGGAETMWMVMREGAANADIPLCSASTTNDVRILADVPRPNSNFATYGWLWGQPVAPTCAVPPCGTSNRVMWMTENNGNCVKGAFGDDCTDSRGIFFSGEGSCDSAGDRTCPWGLKRASANEYLQVVAGDGSFEQVRFVGGISSVVTMPTTASATVYVAETSAYRASAQAVGWTADRLDAQPNGSRGSGFVTSWDRIRYKLDTTTKKLQRQQCWGPSDDLMTIAANCAGSATGTAWETVLNDVEAFRICRRPAIWYMTQSRIPVEVGIEMARTVGQHRVAHKLAFTTWVRSWF